MTTSNLVILFSTGKSNNVRVHAATCPMATSASRRVVRIEWSEDEVADLQERNFKVVYCKCTGKA
jgi:(p)ppGpp synthase/HD superfamily hydrolase